MKVGILGAGNVGSKLAVLFADAGHEVVVGARNLSTAGSNSTYRVATVSEAAAHGEVVILALPFTACADALAPLSSKLADKIIVDATNPLQADWSPLLLGQENSAGEEIARLLPRSKIVKAFNTVFADIMDADHLHRGSAAATLFVCGDHNHAVTQVAEIAKGLGFAPIETGPLRNARYLESMAHLNIAIAVGKAGGTNAAFLYHQVKQ